MAVGKESVERAAKAKNTKSTAASKTATASKKAVSQIVYQPSSGMLERDAMPNESFGLGDAMPIYYF